MNRSEKRLGLEVGTVRLEEYSPEWADEFLAERTELESIFGDSVKTIEHVGSTSVPGLKAKPIIDIAIGVDGLSSFNAAIVLDFAGYSIKQDSDPDEILIRKGKEGVYTDFLIHVMEINSKRYEETLKFRNLLRENLELRNKYQELKEGLAKKYFNDRKSYTASKDRFIKEALGY